MGERVVGEARRASAEVEVSNTLYKIGAGWLHRWQSLTLVKRVLHVMQWLRLGAWQKSFCRR